MSSKQLEIIKCALVQLILNKLADKEQVEEIINNLDNLKAKEDYK